tara:strand:- start:318 stop:839 length:522 start_codon:yes stop_codon:yes gene_type:complete
MRKKGILGEGLVEVVSILLLVGILVVFYILFSTNIDYSEIPGINEIISSKKITSDNLITLNNVLNTPIEDVTFYEFILLNKNDEDKIKKETKKILDKFCKLGGNEEELDPFENSCFWELKIDFKDKEIVLEGVGDKNEHKNKQTFSLNLPDYDNNFVNVELTLFKGLRFRFYR